MNKTFLGALRLFYALVAKRLPSKPSTTFVLGAELGRGAVLARGGEARGAVESRSHSRQIITVKMRQDATRVVFFSSSVSLHHCPGGVCYISPWFSLSTE